MTCDSFFFSKNIITYDLSTVIFRWSLYHMICRQLRFSMVLITYDASTVTFSNIQYNVWFVDSYVFVSHSSVWHVDSYAFDSHSNVWRVDSHVSIAALMYDLSTVTVWMHSITLRFSMRILTYGLPTVTCSMVVMTYNLSTATFSMVVITYD